MSFFGADSEYIKFLNAEILWLRMQVTHERQRAERAIDTLLALKLGVPPITVPTREERMEEETEMDKVLRDPEFTQAGAA